MLCFFIGHRDAEQSLLPQLERAVRTHISEYGVREFVVGHHGSFDRMAAHAVRKAKEHCPGVALSLLLPYYSGEQKEPVPEGFDDILYPPGMETVPRRFALDRANRYMIAHCDYLIAYAWQPGSNAARFLRLAQRRHDLTITTLERT